MRQYMQSEDVDRAWFARIAALDEECKRQKAWEKKIEEAWGVPFPRCPICGGRRENPLLGAVCAYCGVAE